MAVLHRPPSGLSLVLTRGYLWAALLVAAGLGFLIGARYLMFRPLESSRGGDCGTWWKQSELSKYEDAAGLACQDAVTKASIGIAVLVLLALASWVAAGWLVARTRSYRRSSQNAH
jgi:hypothetical protein